MIVLKTELIHKMPITVPSTVLVDYCSIAVTLLFPQKGGSFLEDPKAFFLCSYPKLGMEGVV